MWTVPQTTLPIATLTLLMRRGAAMDPPGREGLAALTLDMLDEGSRGKSAIEMHEELARLGTRLDSDIGSDATMLSLTALSRVSERALSIMAGMAVRPTLAAEDFDRVRQLRLPPPEAAARCRERGRRSRLRQAAVLAAIRTATPRWERSVPERVGD